MTKGAPLYRRNDGGGTIGGPVIIPHVYDGRGKTHFFFSEELRLEKSPTAYRVAVPSLAERNGDFSDVCPTTAVSSFSRAQYPDCPSAGPSGNGLAPLPQLSNIPAGTVLNRNALAIMNSGVIPTPNASSGCNSTIGSCYNTDVSLPTYWREELFRIDHAISARTQLSFRYIHDEWNETTPVPQYGVIQNSFPTIQNKFSAPGTSMVARLTSVFSSKFFNEFMVGYTNSHITLTDQGAPNVNIARPAGVDASCASVNTGVGIPTYQCPMATIFNNNNAGTDGVPKMPGISISGNNAEYGGNGFGVDPSYMPWEHSNPTYSFADNITKIVGRHNLQFGGQWIIFQRNQTNGPIGAATGDTQGILSFNNIKGANSTGNSFADFLYHRKISGDPSNPASQFTDLVASFQQDSAQARYRQRYQIAEPYFQDDFKATTRLTINAGVRLSMFGTFHDAGNNAYNWVPSVFSPTSAATVEIGQGSSGASLFPRNGELVDRASGNDITINPGTPTSGLDPRITNGIVHCGQNGVPSSCMSGHLFNFAPRVGVAWDVRGNGKTSIRAGYGVFYEHGTADEANTGSLEGSSPMVLDMTELNPQSWSSIGLTQQGVPGAAFPLNVTAIPTKAVWPYIQQWSASVERELPHNMLATFAYVGSKGTHLTAEKQLNQLPPLSSSENPFGPHEPLHYSGQNFAANSPNGDCAAAVIPPGATGGRLENGTVVAANSQVAVNLQAACYGVGQNTIYPNSLRTYAPGMGEIYSLENVANSAYNAFQVTARRTQGPLNLGVAYTYSHSLDNASDRSDTSFVNSFDLKSNRASSNFDQRHLLHINYVYDLPLLRFFDMFLHSVDDDPSNDAVHHPAKAPSQNWQSAKIVRTVLGGWQLSGITLFETGTPFTVVNGGSPEGIGTLDNAGVANGTGSGSYPDLSGISAKSSKPTGGNNPKSVGPLLLNPGAFVAPRGLTFGNAGRNDLNNPRRWNTDVAVLKQFATPYDTSVEFRAEAFNVFNATQFRIYDPALGNQANNTVSCYGGAAASYSAAGGDGTDCLTGSSFLHPVDAHRPRTIQFGLKLAF